MPLSASLKNPYSASVIQLQEREVRMLDIITVLFLFIIIMLLLANLALLNLYTREHADLMSILNHHVIEIKKRMNPEHTKKP
jgi:hypothetical protein